GALQLRAPLGDELPGGRGPRVAAEAREELRRVIPHAVWLGEDAHGALDELLRLLDLIELAGEPGAREQIVLTRLGLLDLQLRALVEDRAGAVEVPLEEGELRGQQLALEDAPGIVEVRVQAQAPVGVEGRHLRVVQIHADHRSEEHTSELQSREKLVCRLLLEKKKTEKRRYKTDESEPSRTAGLRDSPGHLARRGPRGAAAGARSLWTVDEESRCQIQPSLADVLPFRLRSDVRLVNVHGIRPISASKLPCWWPSAMTRDPPCGQSASILLSLLPAPQSLPLFFLMILPPPGSTLFPYPTLFR